MSINTAVTVSRNWSAREAGRELALSLTKRVSSSPKLIFVFSTIHYQKNGGFKELLHGFTEIMPSSSLLGCTVAGFISREGCFSRGVAALALSGDFDFEIGVGKNCKLNPVGAGKSCAVKINSSLKNSTYRNKYFVNFVSSAIIPNLPIINNRKIVRELPGLARVMGVFDLFLQFFQLGPGRDEKILAAFSEILSNYSGVGGASCDDLSLEKNFQFFGSDVLSNAIVGAGLATDSVLKVRSSYEFNPTGKSFNITDTSRAGYVVSKFNNAPALGEYLRVMGWSPEILDERLYRKIFYYPLIKNADPYNARMFGLIYNNSFIFPMSIGRGNVEIYSSSGKNLIDSVSKLLSDGDVSALIISCGTRLETLGAKTYLIKEGVLDKKLSGDYLLIYTAGEYSRQDNLTSCGYQSERAIIF